MGLKPIHWMGNSWKMVKEFPKEVRLGIGYALYLAQEGDIHSDAKPLKGFGGAGVLELIENYRGDTYRAVYTVRFRNWIYVLHAFKKKSKKGKQTPRSDIQLIKTRLSMAEFHYKNKSVNNHDE